MSKQDMEDFCLDTGKRVRQKINGQSYYLYVSPYAVVPTVPFENRPDMAKEREVVETIANAITEILETYRNKE